MYEGYLELGGGEVINSARAAGYANTADCSASWLVCPPCDGVNDALAHEPYSFDNLVDAPWYDDEDETTHRFLGVHGLRFDGITDSTREAEVTEGITDGGTVGQVRRATKRIRVETMLTAIGEDALEAGMAWLKAALTPGSCGTHATDCGEADMRFFVACPPDPSTITHPVPVWNLPVTNLVPNPSFEAVTAATTVRTNLATNPSFEAVTAATVEVRRNVAGNPRAANTGSYIATGVGSGLALSTTETHDGHNSIAVTTGGTAASDGLIVQAAAGSAAVPGKTYGGGIWVKAPVAAPLYAVIRTVGASAEDSAQAQFTGTGAWQWIGANLKVAQADAASMQLQVRTRSPWAGTFYATQSLMEERYTIAAASDFFSGATAAAGDYTHAWVGAADASASVKNGVQAPGATSSTGPAKSYASTEWAASGTKSLRVTPVDASNVSYGDIPIAGMVPGKTYTAMVKLRLAAPQTGTIYADARKLSARFLGATVGNSYSAQAPNVAGVHELRWTFTVPADATSVSIRPMNGASAGNGDAWFDDLLVVEGTYTGPYFDGSAPAKVKRNRVPNPSAEMSTAGWLSTRSTFSRDTTKSRYGTASFKLAVTDATSGQSYLINNTALADRVSVTGGETVRMLASVWTPTAIAGMTTQLYEYDAAGVLLTPVLQGSPFTSLAGAWTDIAQDFTVKPTATTVRLVVLGMQSMGVGYEWWVDALSLGTDVYFDGATPVAPYAAAWEGTANASPSYLYERDFTYAWSGTANASTSQQKAVGAVGVNLVTPESLVLTSTVHVSSRARSIKILPQSTNTATYASPGGDIGAMRLGMVAEHTYTALVDLHLPAPQTGTLNPRARSLAVFYRIGTGAYLEFRSPQAPNTAGEHELELTFTLPAGTTEACVRLFNGAAAGGGDVWFDDFLLVEGTYSDGYFDGESPDYLPGDDEIIGRRIQEYAWTGAVDASTSTRRDGVVVPLPDSDAYELQLRKMYRNLHTVTCVSGPTVVQKYHRGNTWGYLVEFVLVAGVPWIFSETMPIAFPPSSPVSIQDTPLNMVPYPSAELALGGVIVATNYAANPSGETNTTGWVVAYDGTAITTGGSAPIQAADPKAVGSSSVTTTWTAPNAGANGSVGLQYEATLAHAALAGERYSVNMWATGNLESGTAVLGTLEVFAYWRAGGTTIGTTSIGVVPGGSGAVSLANIAVPLGATSVIVRAFQRVTSWSTGAKVRVYADALAVTVP